MADEKSVGCRRRSEDGGPDGEAAELQTVRGALDSQQLRGPLPDARVDRQPEPATDLTSPAGFEGMLP